MTRLVLKVCLSLLFLSLAVLGVYVALVGAQTRAIERELNVLSDRVEPSLGEWQALADRSDNLARWASWDFDPQDLNGRVLQFGAQALPADSPKTQIGRFRKAQDAFQRAEQLRPNWAYTQLNLARVEHALDVRGPWEAHLKKALAHQMRDLQLQLDLMHFRKQLGDRLQGELLQSVRASQALALEAHPWELARLAARINRLEWACDQPGPNAAPICKILLAQ
jgi:hypothetical protein